MTTAARTLADRPANGETDPDVERRPQRRTGSGEKVTTTTTGTSVAAGTDTVLRDVLVRMLAVLPDDKIPAAALGYGLGVEDGKALVYAELGQAGLDVARAARPILRWPTYAELQVRRGES